jgi:hypothetical protein
MTGSRFPRKTAMVSFTKLAVLFLAGLLCLSLQGCSSTKNSDVPWNVPQPWEGSPAIPSSMPGGK